MPTPMASTICRGGTLNSLKTNISAPVDMKSGGRIIVFKEAGRFTAFDRTNAASVPMTRAINVDPIIKYIGGTFVKIDYIKSLSPALLAPAYDVSIHQCERTGQTARIHFPKRSVNRLRH